LRSSIGRKWNIRSVGCAALPRTPELPLRSLALWPCVTCP
jgi:hypothetical protein